MVETWQVLTLAAGILVTVLSVYGGLIKVVYDAVGEMQQRFFGADNDETDTGFVGESKQRMGDLEKGQRGIREESRMQSRLMTSIAYGLEDLVAALDNSEGVDVSLDHVRIRDDVHRDGGPDDEDEDNGPMADGGYYDFDPADLPPAPWHSEERDDTE
jgi:hypothetical protein